MNEDRDEFTPVNGIRRAVKGLDRVTVNTRVIVPTWFYVFTVIVVFLLSFQAAFYMGRMQGKFQPVMQAAPAAKGCPAQ